MSREYEPYKQLGIGDEVIFTIGRDKTVYKVNTVPFICGCTVCVYLEGYRDEVNVVYLEKVKK